MRLRIDLAIFLLLLPVLAQAGTVSRVTTFEAGKKAIASEVNAEFDNIISTLNGNINTDNLLDGGVATADIASNAVTTAKIANSAVTRAKLADLGQQISSSSGNYTNTGTATADVTNLSVSITTTGRPVFITLVPEASLSTGDTAFISMGQSGASGISFFYIMRDGVEIGNYRLAATATGATNVTTVVPPGAITFVDTPAAGTYTYKLKASANGAAVDTGVKYCRLVAYEL